MAFSLWIGACEFARVNGQARQDRLPFCTSVDLRTVRFKTGPGL
jgi:hypothetical protein